MAEPHKSIIVVALSWESRSSGFQMAAEAVGALWQAPELRPSGVKPQNWAAAVKRENKSTQHRIKGEGINRLCCWMQCCVVHNMRCPHEFGFGLTREIHQQKRLRFEDWNRQWRKFKCVFLDTRCPCKCCLTLTSASKDVFVCTHTAVLIWGNTDNYQISVRNTRKAQLEALCWRTAGMQGGRAVRSRPVQLGFAPPADTA